MFRYKQNVMALLILVALALTTSAQTKTRQDPHKGKTREEGPASPASVKLVEPPSVDFLSGEANVAVSGNQNPVIRLGLSPNGATIIEFPASDKLFNIIPGNSNLVTVEESPTKETDRFVVVRPGDGFASPATMAQMRRAPATNAGQTAGTSSTQQLKSAGVVSERNPERSIRCAPVPKPVAASNQTTTAAPMAQTARRLPDVLPPDAEKPVALPTFGAMLPVRTLGAIYTLRPSLTRLELTREVRGQGWLLKKGTVLIGRQQGSENDRAYITLVGFIDPASGRLVKLAGDVLGADGAPGLRGKRRQISSRWARVLGRAANAAVSLGQAALTRGGGVNVYLPNAVSPELQSFSPNAISRREFVEVTAGAAAYALVTDLPKEAQGVAPQPTEENQAGSGTTLSDEELANLLSAGSPEQIRAALPRMTPELRQIAEAVLKEQDR
jgi:hypothetical protein